MSFRHNDIEITYTEMGSGPPVVLLHPFPCCNEFWLPVANSLADRYRVILPDLSGMGLTSLGSAPLTMRMHAEHIAVLCNELKLEKAIFGGCSIGGYILFEFWRSYRARVRALMLCNTKAPADSTEAAANRNRSKLNIQQNGSKQFCDFMVTVCTGEYTQRNRPDTVVAASHSMRHSTVEGLVANMDCLGSRQDSLPTLSTINVSCLVIAGDEDKLSSTGDAKAMNDGIRGSQLMTIPETGHYSPFEKHEECAHIMHQFLDRLPTP